ncbi:hypothetical protein KJ974_06470, partial [bacterium]|nr:hypothetical protein [bacterium]
GGYPTTRLYLSQFVTAGVAGARPGAVSALILPRIEYLRDINGYLSLYPVLSYNFIVILTD